MQIKQIAVALLRTVAIISTSFALKAFAASEADHTPFNFFSVNCLSKSGDRSMGVSAMSNRLLSFTIFSEGIEYTYHDKKPPITRVLQLDEKGEYSFVGEFETYQPNGVKQTFKIDVSKDLMSAHVSYQLNDQSTESFEFGNCKTRFSKQ
ncbi:hypothetical protein AB6E94_19365 [Vibrio lentus]|uniref:hypothetical protein n=1 Tax=Vibrio splendidus TaxID=29497 RepID=UPI000C8518F0|nr:hypothetical protein [Vibrio splendidus]PMG17860.1 hypothetical protein BCU98_00575 [Vibrio splendidus]